MKSRQLLREINARAAERSKAHVAQFNNGDARYDWAARHCSQWRTASLIGANGDGRPGNAIVLLLIAAATYADAHRTHFESFIGDDYVLGGGWAGLLQGTRALLNGDCGALDCGTLDTMISELATLNHVNPETYELGYGETSNA